MMVWCSSRTSALTDALANHRWARRVRILCQQERLAIQRQLEHPLGRQANPLRSVSMLLIDISSFTTLRLTGLTLAMHYPFVLAFEPTFIEVRHVDTGALVQIVTFTSFQARRLAARTLTTGLFSRSPAVGSNACMTIRQYRLRRRATSPATAARRATPCGPAKRLGSPCTAFHRQPRVCSTCACRSGRPKFCLSTMGTRYYAFSRHLRFRSALPFPACHC